VKQVPVTIDEHITALEKTLISGRGRWIADFNESKRNYRMNDIMFDALIEGNTRMKGFLLSRLFSFLLNPNYSVSCFVLSTKTSIRLDHKFLTKVLSTIKSYMKENEVKWSWLFIFSDGKAKDLKRTVQKIDDQTIGVALIDVNMREIVHSNSYLGKQAKRFIKF